MNHEYPFLVKLGLNISNFAHGSTSLTLGDGPACLSTRHPQKSALPAMRLTITNIDQLSTLIEHKSGNATAELDPLAKDETGQSWPDLNAETAAKFRTALFQHLTSQQGIPASLKKEAELHFLPMPVSVFAAKDITIPAGTVFTIGAEDHDPVVCDFGTVTLEEGGQIRVEAPAIINIEAFIKKAA